MTAWRIAWSPLWLPGIALALAVALFALEAPSAARQTNAVLAAVGVLLTWTVAAAMRARYPQRPMATLLFVLATLLAIYPALTSSSNPTLFALARLVRVAAEWMIVWVMLAFPSGRLAERIDRWLLGGLLTCVLLLWLPAILFTPELPIGGPLLTCDGKCPRNVLFVSDQPVLAKVLIVAFRVAIVLLLLGTVLRLLQRLSRASPLMRRVLAPVQAVFVLRLASLIAYVGSGGGFAWLPVLLYAGIPVAMAYGLLRGRLWIARALQQLVTGLRATPARGEMQALIARALGDASLQIGYWRSDSSRWVDADGRELRVPDAGDTQRAARMITGERGEAAAVLVHDAALLEEPALVEAVANSMRMALAGHQLEAALQTTRQDAAQAAATERERIERDLHDGAQQRLLALRIKLGVVQRLLEPDPARAADLLAETGPDIDAALAELRELSHGIVPGLLLEEGLTPALAQLAQRCPNPVRLKIESVGRLDRAVEQAVYYCCAEALQNAAKHAGRDATVELALCRQENTLRFGVNDNGPGLRAGETSAAGRGLHNMRKRLADVGGHLVIESRPTGGLSVEGSVPLQPT